MDFVWIYLVCVLGVIISIVLPILVKALPVVGSNTLAFGEEGEPGAPSRLAQFWALAKPYVVIGIFSMLTAVLIVALAGNTLNDWRAAILAGYAWDSTLQKFRK